MLGFQQSISDYSLFIKKFENSITVLLVYVDDIILTGSHETELQKFKDFMKSQLLIKDLGILKYFLGIEVVNLDNGLCLIKGSIVLNFCMSMVYLVVNQ